MPSSFMPDNQVPTQDANTKLIYIVQLGNVPLLPQPYMIEVWNGM